MTEKPWSKIEVKVMTVEDVKNPDIRWEDLPFTPLTLEEGEEIETAIRRFRFCWETLNPQAVIWEIRFNYEGSFQGHYYPIAKIEQGSKLLEGIPLNCQ
jgi:hypothetical protein